MLWLRKCDFILSALTRLLPPLSRHLAYGYGTCLIAAPAPGLNVVAVQRVVGYFRRTDSRRDWVLMKLHRGCQRAKSQRPGKINECGGTN